ncbi:hypothetical protein LUZ60_008093 [Juncus effusus]|nr:hypothetical protein LUZ60_008093 [Juncus effusus]
MSLFPILSLLLLRLLFTSSESYPSCLKSPSKCGNNITIKYPFILYNPETHDSHGGQSPSVSSYCGYPGLSISCEDNNTTAILHLKSDNYTVLSIDYNTSTLTLADTDILNTDDSCPRVNRNVSFDPYDWINLTNLDTNLIFFYNCSNQFRPTYGSQLQPCLGENSYVIQAIEPSEYYHLSDFCQEMVVAPILNDSDNPYNWSNGLGAPLKKGFQLHWDNGSGNCSKCEANRGQCGYNLTSDSHFVEACWCEGGKCSGRGTDTLTGEKKARFKREIIGASIGVCCLLAFCTFSFLFFRRYDRKVWLTGTGERNKTLKIEASLEDCITIVPKRYNFYEIRKMTRSFSENLGQGGYGTVYKGKLINGTLIAVKVFKDRESNGEEFINEVASIARTSHVNIVRLLGFSIRGSKRALIYEFMPNGSLDKYLRESQKSTLSHIECERLFEITVGIARGLEYLHRGCNTRIVHFDIKPHNILLDQDYHPKISDFGLAKFCRPKESIISMTGMRGTIGYIAPEVFSRNFGTISSKYDVYSFGMMVFEMLGEKQNKPSEIQGCSETYFPDNIYNYLEENTISSVYGLSNVNEEIVTKLVIVGLWCIQLFPDSRPTMSRVLEMLEGNIEDLSIPQKLSLPLPPELVVDSSSTT